MLLIFISLSYWKENYLYPDLRKHLMQNIYTFLRQSQSHSYDLSLNKITQTKLNLANIYFLLHAINYYCLFY